MHEHDYRKALGELTCAAETRVQYFDSRETNHNDDWITGTDLEAKFPSIASLVDENVSRSPSTTASINAPLILISTTGSAKSSGVAYIPLGISHTSLAPLINVCGFPKYLVSIQGHWTSHLSRHIHYDLKTKDPVAISLIVQTPRNSQRIMCALRIRIADLSTVCILDCRLEATMTDVRSRFIRYRGLITKNPLIILSLVYDTEMAIHLSWQRQNWDALWDLETSTGMLPDSWKRTGSQSEKLKDQNKFLKELHGVQVELSLQDSVMSSHERFGNFLIKTLEIMESLAPQLQQDFGTHIEITQMIEYNQELCCNGRIKAKELLNRIQAQINATFSLFSQRTSNGSIYLARDSQKIAMLGIRDSQTMKTITVITLVFLPLSLVTSIWSANIFTLDAKTSWKIYLATGISASVIVFAIWFMYVSVSRKREKLELSHLREFDIEKDFGGS